MTAPGKGADELTAAIASRSGVAVLPSPASVPEDLRGLWPTLSAEEQAAVAPWLPLGQDGSHQTAPQLMLAACKADDAAAVAALAKDASLVNSGDSVESSPLHVAIKAGAARAVQALVRAGADARRSVGNVRLGDTYPIQLARTHKRADIMAVLIGAGARFAAWPAAPYAAMPEELLWSFAEAAVHWDGYVSVVAAAACNSSAGVLRWLVQHGCCTDAAIVATAVEVATCLGRAEHLEVLLGLGVSREVTGRALEAAVGGGCVPAVRMLLGCGAPCPPAQRGALLMSAMPHVEHSEEVVSLLLDTFGDDAALHDHGVALLCACFRHKNAAMALRLVRAGVNVGVPLGEMPEEVVQQLVEVVRSKARVKPGSIKRHLLRAACRAACVELLLWLLDQGMPRSALHAVLSADEAYDVAILEMLLAADPAVPADVLSEALVMACKHGGWEHVRLLLECGATWARPAQAWPAMLTSRQAFDVWLELLDAGAVPLGVFSTRAVPHLCMEPQGDLLRTLLACGVPFRLQLPSFWLAEPVDASADAEWAAGILQASRVVSTVAVVRTLARSGGLASFLRLRGWGLWPHLALCLHNFVVQETAAETLLLLSAGADPLAPANAGGSSAYVLIRTPIRQYGEPIGRRRFSDADRSVILLAMASVMRWRRRRWPIVACSLWGDEWWADAAAAAAGAEESGGVGHKRERHGDGGCGEDEGEGPPAAKRAPPASGDGE
jgi:hypothetical protein